MINPSVEPTLNGVTVAVKAPVGELDGVTVELGTDGGQNTSNASSLLRLNGTTFSIRQSSNDSKVEEKCSGIASELFDSLNSLNSLNSGRTHYRIISACEKDSKSGSIVFGYEDGGESVVKKFTWKNNDNDKAQQAAQKYFNLLSTDYDFVGSNEGQNKVNKEQFLRKRLSDVGGAEQALEEVSILTRTYESVSVAPDNDTFKNKLREDSQNVDASLDCFATFGGQNKVKDDFLSKVTQDHAKQWGKDHVKPKRDNAIEKAGVFAQALNVNGNEVDDFSGMSLEEINTFLESKQKEFMQSPALKPGDIEDLKRVLKSKTDFLHSLSEYEKVVNPKTKDNVVDDSIFDINLIASYKQGVNAWVSKVENNPKSFKKKMLEKINFEKIVCDSEKNRSQYHGNLKAVEDRLEVLDFNVGTYAVLSTATDSESENKLLELAKKNEKRSEDFPVALSRADLEELNAVKDFLKAKCSVLDSKIEALEAALAEIDVQENDAYMEVIVDLEGRDYESDGRSSRGDYDSDCDSDSSYGSYDGGGGGCGGGVWQDFSVRASVMAYQSASGNPTMYTSSNYSDEEN